MRKTCSSRLEPDQAHGPAVPWSTSLLVARVHWDGFRCAPLKYLQAVFWQLTGKKLRARNCFSRLNGRSSQAYRLWMARSEPVVCGALPRSMPASGPSITVVIDKGGDPELVAATTASVLASDRNATIVTEWPVEPAGWVLPLRAGDLLAPEALPTYAGAVLRHEGATIIYADDDLLDETGKRHAPYFKPDWNPGLFEHHDYLTHSALLCWQSSLAPGANRLKQVTAAALRKALVPPIHLPFVLHHRRNRAAPSIPQPVPACADLTYPHVTVLVPTRDRLELLRTCLDGLSETCYPCFDCVVIDNDSREPQTKEFLRALPSDRFSVLPFPGKFNYSAMNNAAARTARGKFLCFLNNDIEIIDPAWLHAMITQATRDDCGAVGAKLLYPDGTIQHAGVVTGVGGGAAHAHRFLGQGQEGYFHRAHLPQQVSAVTAACMVVEKRKFLEVGGFDPTNFAVAFNDVDLCLKLNARGWQCFYEPRAVLVHHESKSRGDDREPTNRVRFAGELAALKRIWGTDLRPDPFHHPQLSPFSETFVVSI